MLEICTHLSSTVHSILNLSATHYQQSFTFISWPDRLNVSPRYLRAFVRAIYSIYIPAVSFCRFFYWSREDLWSVVDSHLDFHLQPFINLNPESPLLSGKKIICCYFLEVCRSCLGSLGYCSCVNQVTPLTELSLHYPTLLLIKHLSSRPSPSSVLGTSYCLTRHHTSLYMTTTTSFFGHSGTCPFSALPIHGNIATLISSPCTPLPYSYFSWP